MQLDNPVLSIISEVICLNEFQFVGLDNWALKCFHSVSNLFKSQNLHYYDIMKER